MDTVTLLRRNLTYFWRTNLAVVAGVAIAVSVLAGAALVGESVKASLRSLFLERTGATQSVITGSSFFREKLADAFPASCPLIALDGLVIGDHGRAGHVAMYGVDDRFWQFQGRRFNAPGGREILLSPSLAGEIGAAPGDSIVARVQKPSAIPAEWLHGRKDDAGRAMRFTVRDVLAPDQMGEFSLRAQQGAVRAAFVPLSRLQRELELAGKANTILLSADRGPDALRKAFTLADAGLKLRGNSLEADSALIPDALAARAQSVAASLGMQSAPVFTYLANSIRVAGREIPYSLVTAMDSGGLKLNEWAARDLGAKPGDKVTLEYFVWKDEGRLATDKAEFPLTEIVPTRDQRDLAPDYPGMTDAAALQDWDPPFPVDLRRVRPRDEDYWKQYRTTPKAFLPLEAGQRLWGSRFGKLTSIRFDRMPADFEQKLRDAIDPLQAGLAIVPVRRQGLAAAQGSTDFGEYFTYFSFFLVISALTLTGLFFRLGIEQRLREAGTLRALGFSAGKMMRLFLLEGLALSGIGSLIGVVGAAGFSALALLGLRTIWVDAVGTRHLTLHLSAGALAGGAAGGIAAALISIMLSARKLRSLSPLRLLSGGGGLASAPKRRHAWSAIAAGSAAVAMLAASATKSIDPTAGFFGAGALLLAACLLIEWNWLAARRSGAAASVKQLGFRNAGYRPGRSILCIALVGLATFLVVAVDAFRKPAEGSSGDPKGGDGGYPLLAESILPVFYDLNSPAGQQSLNLAQLGKSVTIARFRLRPGDDVSCLNLYQPRNPRILAPTADFLRQARFSFQGAGANQNPWLLLEAAPVDGAVPAIVDANTLEYTLHLNVGDVFTAGGVKLRIAAALRDSIFQSEFLISEPNFTRLFPRQEGYQFFLIDTAQPPQTTELLEQSLSDYGFDVEPASGRLANFHRVENTYLSTFQTLGTLGLILGTAGLAAVMLRNILERRRELALLRAMGYREGDLALMVGAESLLLLLSGLAIGVVCALLAIAPAFAARGGRFSPGSLGLLLAGVLASGLAASWVAMRAVTRSPLLAALRAE